MDLVPAPGAWPLPAAATTLLRVPRTAPAALLRASLRELVVRGVLRVEVVQQGGRHADVSVWRPASSTLPACRRRCAGTGGGCGPAGWGDDELDQLDGVLGDAGPGLDGAADGGSGGDAGGDGGGGGGD